ncbi:hypothetical protein CR513_53848, partial [Mucuna pruriens]
MINSVLSFGVRIRSDEQTIGLAPPGLGPPLTPSMDVYLDQYDGTTNLDEHLAKYVTQVNMFSNEDAILCRIFLRVDPTLVYLIGRQLDRLVCDTEAKVQNTIFDHSPSPPNSRGLGQPATRKK